MVLKDYLGVPTLRRLEIFRFVVTDGAIWIFLHGRWGQQRDTPTDKAAQEQKAVERRRQKKR